MCNILTININNSSFQFKMRKRKKTTIETMLVVNMTTTKKKLDKQSTYTNLLLPILHPPR